MNLPFMASFKAVFHFLWEQVCLFGPRWPPSPPCPLDAIFPVLKKMYFFLEINHIDFCSDNNLFNPKNEKLNLRNSVNRD